MRHRLNIGMLFLTFLAGGAGMAVWYLLFARESFGGGVRILATGIFFAVSLVMGLLGLFLAEFLQKRRFQVIQPGRRLLSLLLAAVLGMGIGAGGQALYALSWQAGPDREADIVLLLDGSDSMQKNWDACREAACAFIDQTRETSRIQAISFGAWVLDSTGLTAMDKAGKEEIKAFIRQIDIVGGTDFDAALAEAALQLLGAENRDGRRQAVVMVTDGQAELGSEIQDVFKEGKLAFYPIQFCASGGAAARMDALTDFAKAAGGFDTRLEQDKNGKIDMRSMKDAFASMYADTREISQDDVWLSFGAITGNTAWRCVIRLFSFALFAVLAGYVYYRRQTKSQILANAAAGCLTGALITLAGSLPGEGAVFAAMLLADFFVVSAWAKCRTAENR